MKHFLPILIVNSVKSIDKKDETLTHDFGLGENCDLFRKFISIFQ